MKLKGHWFKYLLYISLVFLVIALIRADYFVIPQINHFGILALSILMVLLAFLFVALRWQQLLNRNGLKISLGASLSSSGLPVFAKYIPGKFLIVLGKAGYLNSKYGYANDRLITLSFNDQFLSLWTGIIIGSLGLFQISKFDIWGIIIIVALIILTFLIFSSKPHAIVEKLILRFFKKKVNIPAISFMKTITVLPWYFVYWLLLSAGFYFLIVALSTDNLPYSAGFLFPLATILGIITIIAPGGIGVREGILVFCLKLYGMETELAVTISVASRLWFFCGETFIFLMGLICDKFSKKKE